MAARLSTEASRKAHARRKWLSEAPNGWIKEALGFRRFSVRGLGKVRGEWDLGCLALNVRRLLGAAGSLNRGMGAARAVPGRPSNRPGT